MVPVRHRLTKITDGSLKPSRKSQLLAGRRAKMHLASNARRVCRVFQAPLGQGFLGSASENFDSSGRWHQSRHFASGSSRVARTPCAAIMRKLEHHHHPICSTMARAYLTSQAGNANDSPTEVVNEMYNKMLKALEAETMPPNAWLWSLIANCTNREDVKLLFEMLQKLCRFRLSNLRIHTDFNSDLCQNVAKACVRSGAMDYAKKTLWKHNVYGLAPSIASAHHLLLHAKERNDIKCMVDTMNLFKKNDLPLQPGTADITFSICSATNKWKLISKYAKKFIKAGVKLRRTSFGTWMEFAAKRGDLESLWKIEELRSNTVKQHNLATGFSCAKGHILEHKPENAASLINILHQNMSEQKKPEVLVELQKLVAEWPLEVIKQQQKENRVALAASLNSDIMTMIGILANLESALAISSEDLSMKKAIPL